MLAEKLLDPNDPRDLTVLRGMLSSPDEIARLSAAERLMNTRFSGEAQAVIAKALESRDEGVRHLALELASKNPALQPALARFLESGDPEIRQAAITAAGNLRQREKFARITVYLSDSSPAVSLAAARALASIDASAARPIFLRGLTSDLSHVRIYSAATLLTVDREFLRPKP